MSTRKEMIARFEMSRTEAQLALKSGVNGWVVALATDAGMFAQRHGRGYNLGVSYGACQPAMTFETEALAVQFAGFWNRELTDDNREACTVAAMTKTALLERVVDTATALIEMLKAAEAKA